MSLYSTKDKEYDFIIFRTRYTYRLHGNKKK